MISLDIFIDGLSLVTQNMILVVLFAYWISVELDVLFELLRKRIEIGFDFSKIVEIFILIEQLGPDIMTIVNSFCCVFLVKSMHHLLNIFSHSYHENLVIFIVYGAFFESRLKVFCELLLNFDYLLFGVHFGRVLLQLVLALCDKLMSCFVKLVLHKVLV
jgi:hypothetical protein